MSRERGVLEWLTRAHESRRPLLVVLVDPDHLAGETLGAFVAHADASGVDAFLVGGSLSMATNFGEAVHAMKAVTRKPVIIFPGGVHHVDSRADAILFLSIVSSRNPEYLFGQHVIAAPLIRHVGLEALSTGYMIVESDRVSSTEYMSGSKPIPRHKPDIAVAHAMAAEMMGMKLVYLEAGSGADQTVPDVLIRAVSSQVRIPVIVGGGIRTPETAAEKVRAGASIVIVGNHFERAEHHAQLPLFAEAVHGARESRIEVV
jgi:phosphoglycerol geranylgeranyltransferase